MNSRHLVDPELAPVLDQLPPPSGPLTSESLPMIRAGSAALLAGRLVPEFPGRTVSERLVPGPEGAPDYAFFSISRRSKHNLQPACSGYTGVVTLAVVWTLKTSLPAKWPPSLAALLYP